VNKYFYIATQVDENENVVALWIIVYHSLLFNTYDIGKYRLAEPRLNSPFLKFGMSRNTA